MQNGRNKIRVAFDSGYIHGCSDAKIPDISQGYLNQLGMAPAYNTNEFM